MLRKSGLICAAAVLLGGCDLFSTREFRSKPTEIRALSGLRQAGDSISFRSTETVWKTGAAAPEKILSARRYVFILAGDSLDGGDTLKKLTLRVREDSSGAIIETAGRLVRFTSQGVILVGTATGGAARYFPLKIAAAYSAAYSAEASADTSSETSAPADPASILAIPALLVEGWAETRAMGVLTVTRRQASIDTLDYQGRREEAWVIRESVGDGTAPLSVGDYWYGASGLLRVEQVWAGFDWRNQDGAGPVNADGGGSSTAELRRTVVRL